MNAAVMRKSGTATPRARGERSSLEVMFGVRRSWPSGPLARQQGPKRHDVRLVVAADRGWIGSGGPAGNDRAWNRLGCRHGLVERHGERPGAAPARELPLLRAKGIEGGPIRPERRVVEGGQVGDERGERLEV